jgi:hypothetical protein
MPIRLRYSPGNIPITFFTYRLKNDWRDKSKLSAISAKLSCLFPAVCQLLHVLVTFGWLDKFSVPSGNFDTNAEIFSAECLLEHRLQ